MFPTEVHVCQVQNSVWVWVHSRPFASICGWFFLNRKMPTGTGYSSCHQPLSLKGTPHSCPQRRRTFVRYANPRRFVSICVHLRLVFPEPQDANQHDLLFTPTTPPRSRGTTQLFRTDVRACQVHKCTWIRVHSRPSAVGSSPPSHHETPSSVHPNYLDKYPNIS